METETQQKLKTILITGGAGFLGANLAARMLQYGGWRVIIYDTFLREGSRENVKWLKTIGNVEVVDGNIEHYNSIYNTIKKYEPNVITHLAGQVSMQSSLERPNYDFDVNAIGTLNVLEIVRLLQLQCRIIYSSSNKVYGKITKYGPPYLRENETRYFITEDDFDVTIDENETFAPSTPYGCSKGTADLYMREYANTYGLDTIIFRHSTIYGPHQWAVETQGWVNWFCGEALELKLCDKTNGEVKVSGTGKQVRDILHVKDAVEAYLSVINTDKSVFDEFGRVFNIGGGPEYNMSIIELLQLLKELTGVNISMNNGPERLNDQRVYISNVYRAQRAFGWEPKIGPYEGIKDTLLWLQS